MKKNNYESPSMEMVEVKSEKGFATSFYSDKRQPCYKCGKTDGYPNTVENGKVKYKCDACSRKEMTISAIILSVIVIAAAVILIFF